MKEIRAVELTDVDFLPYGRVVRLAPKEPGVVACAGDGWSGVFTSEPVLDRAGSLGYTISAAAPCTTATMERHHHTKEALFTITGPVLLAVADTDADAPRADDVCVVVIRHGDLVILNEGTWHDVCHGLGVQTPYYWHNVSDPSIVDPWIPIDGGPLRLTY